MTAPFYQVKLVVNDMYVEYTTSDSKAMDKFLGKEEDTQAEVIESREIPSSVIQQLKEAFKGNGKLE